jgi:hypothetical protein
MLTDIKQESKEQKKKVYLGKKTEQACNGFYTVAVADAYYDDDVEDKLDVKQI